MSEEKEPKPRLLYHQVMERDSMVFMEHMLEEIPELESVAIVPSYAINNTEVPYAFVMGQSGPLRNPIEIVHMCQQLWRTLAFQLNNGQNLIKSLDDYMKQQTQELQTLQNQITAAKAELVQLQPREADDDKS